MQKHLNASEEVIKRGFYNTASKSILRPWLIWGFAAIFFFAEYFARVAPSVMLPNLIKAFHVNAFNLGVLSAFFYYAYVAMQIPVGILIDRYGAYKLLTASSFLCGASCVFFAVAHYLFLAELARLCMGITAAFAFVGALKLARTWFASSKFGFLAGATQALGMLGAAIGEGPVSSLVVHVGWQKSMMLIGFFLISLGVCIAIFVEDAPKENKHQLKNRHVFKSLLHVLKNKQCWLNGIFVGFLYAPTAAFAELWGPSYIHSVFNVDKTLAASAIGLIFIGFAISSPLVGLISDKIKRRKPIMLVSALCSLALISVALYYPHLSFMSIAIILFLYGASNVGVATCYAVAGEIVSADNSATSMSFANMASVLIGALLQPIIGYLIDYKSHISLHASLSMISSSSYKFSMSVLPICILVSIVAWFFIKESYLNERGDK